MRARINKPFPVDLLFQACAALQSLKALKSLQKFYLHLFLKAVSISAAIYTPPPHFLPVNYPQPPPSFTSTVVLLSLLLSVFTLEPRLYRDPQPPCFCISFFHFLLFDLYFSDLFASLQLYLSVCYRALLHPSSLFLSLFCL